MEGVFGRAPKLQEGDSCAMIVELTQGQVAMIDDDDWPTIGRGLWYAAWSPLTKSYYAAQNCERNEARRLMHRVILAVTDPEIFVDHWNHNTLDNRRSNLRIVSRSHNRGNSRKVKVGSSRYKGVSWNTARNLWQAFLYAEKPKRLGFYDSEEAAAMAYNDAAAAHFGEFAHLNDVPAGSVARHRSARYSSRIKGVSFDAVRNKWSANVTVDGSSKRLGRFSTENEAATALNDYFRKVGGQ